MMSPPKFTTGLETKKLTNPLNRQQISDVYYFESKPTNVMSFGNQILAESRGSI